MTPPSPDLLRFGMVGAPPLAPEGAGTPGAIRTMRAIGLDHFEIAWVRSVRVSDATLAAIRAAAQECRVTLSVHAPYFINLNSQDATRQAASDARLLAAARAGWACGAHDIVFHPGSYHTQPPTQVYDVAVANLHRIAAQLAAEGVAVTLRPETMGKASLFGDLDEVLRLARDVPGVQPCVDWAHLYARTACGGMNSAAEFDEALARYADVLGPGALQRVHFHLSGIAYTPKGEKQHIPLIECAQDMRALLGAFLRHGLAGSIAVEAPNPFMIADALTLQATYRHLRDQAVGVAAPKRHARADEDQDTTDEDAES